MSPAQRSALTGRILGSALTGRILGSATRFGERDPESVDSQDQRPRNSGTPGPRVSHLKLQFRDLTHHFHTPGRVPDQINLGTRHTIDSLDLDLDLTGQ